MNKIVKDDDLLLPDKCLACEARLVSRTTKFYITNSGTLKVSNIVQRYQCGSAFERNAETVIDEGTSPWTMRTEIFTNMVKPCPQHSREAAREFKASH